MAYNVIHGAIGFVALAFIVFMAVMIINEGHHDAGGAALMALFLGLPGFYAGTLGSGS